MYLDPAIELVLRCAFFALFASALAHKLSDYTAFQGTLAAYLRGVALPGGAVTHVIGGALIAGEALAVFACVAAVPPGLRAGVIAGLLLLYSGAMAWNIRRGNTLLDCGCHWGRDVQPVGYPLVWRNVLMALAAAPLALPVSGRALSAFDLFTVVAGTAVAALVYVASNGLAANAAQQPAGSRR